MLAPQQQTALWPPVSNADELETIIADQWKTIAAQEALLHDMQTVLNTAQNPPSGTAATATGNASNSTSLTVTAQAVALIAVGSTVNGVGVPTGTKVLGQISGTAGSNGVYLLNQAVSLTNIALTFTPPAPATTWPLPSDPATLLVISQQQTAVLRLQNALIQNYTDLLNTSETSPT